MPYTHHIGRSFHFVRTIYRQVQQLQLTTAYGEDEKVRSNVRNLMALALVPIENIETVFEEVKKQTLTSVKPLLEYFDRYWMSKVKWSWWNVGDVELRTNKMVKGELDFLLLIACTSNY